MSRENVELVRSICAAWDRGEYGNVEWADPEIEFVIADGPAPSEWTGLDGMAAGWRSWLRAWDDFQQKLDRIQELDEERVLALFRASGRGKTSGLELGELGPGGAGLFHLRDGAVTRFVVYLNSEIAFADLGRPG